MVPVGQIQPQKNGPVVNEKAITQSGRLIQKNDSVNTVPMSVKPCRVLRTIPNTPRQE